MNGKTTDQYSEDVDFSNSLDFVSILERLSKHPDFTFCDNAEERSGAIPHLCVYQHEDYIGKIRFVDPLDINKVFCPRVEETIITALQQAGQLMTPSTNNEA